MIAGIRVSRLDPVPSAIADDRVSVFNNHHAAVHGRLKTETPSSLCKPVLIDTHPLPFFAQAGPSVNVSIVRTQNDSVSEIRRELHNLSLQRLRIGAQGMNQCALVVNFLVTSGHVFPKPPPTLQSHAGFTSCGLRKHVQHESITKCPSTLLSSSRSQPLSAPAIMPPLSGQPSLRSTSSFDVVVDQSLPKWGVWVERRNALEDATTPQD
ncbi:hypothetical protein C8R42DRAFT_776772 [Lentinula raphanica]|nr:hypothetical protein C8R42DRAFT_776772 [Lentinula raphanica]